MAVLVTTKAGSRRYGRRTKCHGFGARVVTISDVSRVGLVGVRGLKISPSDLPDVQLFHVLPESRLTSRSRTGRVRTRYRCSSSGRKPTRRGRDARSLERDYLGRAGVGPGGSLSSFLAVHMLLPKRESLTVRLTSRGWKPFTRTEMAPALRRMLRSTCSGVKAETRHSRGCIRK